MFKFIVHTPPIKSLTFIHKSEFSMYLLKHLKLDFGLCLTVPFTDKKYWKHCRFMIKKLSCLILQYITVCIVKFVRLRV